MNANEIKNTVKQAVKEEIKNIGPPQDLSKMIPKSKKIVKAITKPRVKGFRTIGVGFGISYLGYLQTNPELMADIGLTPFWTGTIQMVLGSLVIPVLRQFTNTKMGHTK